MTISGVANGLGLINFADLGHVSEHAAVEERLTVTAEVAPHGFSARW